MDDELAPPSARRIKQMQEGYQELVEMDQQLKIWEMILEYLASVDFLLVIFMVFFGVALVKSVGVVDRYLNGQNDASKQKEK